MPVIDHEVHSSVKQDSTAKYSCWNKERTREDLLVKDGWIFHGDFTKAVQKFKVVSDFGSLECRYDKSLIDNKCKGCQHAGTGEMYDAMVKENGK